VIKNVIETAIKRFGETGKLSVIRSQKLIKLIHEAVKAELIKNGVNPSCIIPELGKSAGELKLAGLLKKKDQDISIRPIGLTGKKEILKGGLLDNQEDVFGKHLTESMISINVRSQLSSLSGNIDSLYERTFAEALNLHKRCPKMCLGEVYMIPAYEYDKHEAQKKKIKFVNKSSDVESYLKAYEAINNRKNARDEPHKYERVCLLIVDFSQKTPKYYSSVSELKKDTLLPKTSSATIKNLRFKTFVPGLLNIYSTRFKYKFR